MTLLNIDLGELPDESPRLYAVADIANIACGGHAGTHETMVEAVERCLEAKTALGAHPSYPDAANFGRVSLEMSSETLRDHVRRQCLALRYAMMEVYDRHEKRGHVPTTGIEYVKAHGALYHDLAEKRDLALGFVLGAMDAYGPNFTLIGRPRGWLEKAAAFLSVPYFRERFADRATNAIGVPVPRDEPGAVITDPLLAAVNAKICAEQGAETVCVHGDNPNAVEVAERVRRAIDSVWRR